MHIKHSTSPAEHSLLTAGQPSEPTVTVSWEDPPGAMRWHDRAFWWVPAWPCS